MFFVFVSSGDLTLFFGRHNLNFEQPDSSFGRLDRLLSFIVQWLRGVMVVRKLEHDSFSALVVLGSNCFVLSLS